MGQGEFTLLLERWSGGDNSALKVLTPVVYKELHRLAAANFARERPGHTLQCTALIHEAYIKLVEHKQDQWHGRAHFFSMASRIMRQILISHARKNHAQKRGSGQQAAVFDEALGVPLEDSEMVLSLHDALNELAKVDERKARLIELKYFGGLSGAEIEQALHISVATITRESRLAEAWLQRYLSGS
jgi:RNA polymerase sigma factor (TIGR02999 family)